MTYVILHGTASKIERGEIDDGHMYSYFASCSSEKSWDFEKSFKKDAKSALVDGNYFSEKYGGVYPGKITQKDRKFIHDRYLNLINIIKDQLDKKGRFDIDLLGYFEPEGADTTKCINRLRTVIEDISRGRIKDEALVKIMSAVEEAGY